jgi:hypothetical protein
VGALVGRIVIDVQARVPPSTFRDVVEKVHQGLFLLCEIVRPECPKSLVGLHQAKQVVESPLRALPVQRITLEVEEDVARIGIGYCGEARRRDDSPGQPGSELHDRLFPQRGHHRLRQTRHLRGRGGELLDGRDARLE